LQLHISKNCLSRGGEKFLSLKGWNSTPLVRKELRGAVASGPELRQILILLSIITAVYLFAALKDLVVRNLCTAVWLVA